jgi:hypothetical protein
MQHATRVHVVQRLDDLVCDERHVHWLQPLPPPPPPTHTHAQSCQLKPLHGAHSVHIKSIYRWKAW